MKRIVVILAVCLISFNIFSQTSGGLEDYLKVLKSDTEVENFDLTQFQNYMTADVEKRIKTKLVANGLDTTVISSTMKIVKEIKAGTLANFGSSADYQKAKEGIVTVFATLAKEKLSSGSTMGVLTDGVKMLKGALGSLAEFGQANALTSVGASQFGYQGYKTVAVSLGPTFALSTDGKSMDSAINLVSSSNMMSTLTKKFKDGGFNVGVAVQGINARVGLNVGWLVENLYLGIVLGSTDIAITNKGLSTKALGIPVFNSTSIKVDGLSASVSSSVFGVTANYQLIKTYNPSFLFSWNGVNVGSGLIHTGYTVDATYGLADLLAKGTGGMNIGRFDGVFKISASSITIPMEISTGVRLLSSINISCGLGADIKMGGSAISFKIKTDHPDSMGTKIVENILDSVLNDEDLKFPYEDKGSIQLINPRFMFGLGIGFGPVTLLDFSGTASISPGGKMGLTVGMNLVVRL